MVDDPFITDMDPIQKLWMYENWIADQNDRIDLAKNHAYLLASFSNPEAVKNIIGDGNTHVSSDDEFEESSKLVREINLKDLKEKSTKRRRHRLKE